MSTQQDGDSAVEALIRRMEQLGPAANPSPCPTQSRGSGVRSCLRGLRLPQWSLRVWESHCGVL